MSIKTSIFILMSFISLQSCKNNDEFQFDKNLTATYAKIIIYHDEIKLARNFSDSTYNRGVDSILNSNLQIKDEFWASISQIQRNVKRWNKFLISANIAFDSLKKD
ncbi:MAG: hypothetical protein AAB255_01025 [Bacteroidota bacterium]